jgi:diguanylate cyclase (GGDEF)-like protein/PAS domain S-box-containing protein
MTAFPSRAASLLRLHEGSAYMLLLFGEDGAPLGMNGLAAGAFGTRGAATVFALYPPWAVALIRDEALPAARANGYWRGELAWLGAEGRQREALQVLEFYAATADEPAFVSAVFYQLGDADAYASRLRFKRLFEEHPHPMWVYDLETLRFLVVNAAAVQQYGYAEHEFAAMTIRDIRPPEDVAKLDSNLAATPVKGPDRSGLWTHCRKDGSRITVDISSHSVTLSGRRARFVFAHDVTEQIRLANALHASEEMHAHVINHVPQQIFWKGLDLRYRGCNAVFARAAGLSSNDEVVGKNDFDFPWAANAERIRAEDQRIVDTDAPLLDYEDIAVFADGDRHWLINKLPLHDRHGRIAGVLGTIEDVTERKRYQARLEHQASHDALTGLPNRSLFGERLDQAIGDAGRDGRPLWVVFIDLDNFKLVNDSLGHQSGDELLRIVSARLAACIRASDTVARLGGDEFMLILPHQGPGAAEALAPLLERVLGAVAAPVALGAGEQTVTCSIGVSRYPEDGGDAELLLKHADIAMYRAKEAGRNQIRFYEAAMNARIAERALIETQLRHALPRGELSLHYQPRVDLRSGQVTGMEALLRWTHPQLGMVRPDRFVGIAEETGLIVPIGAWVLGAACRQNKAWQAAGLPRLPVAVNLSPRQFRDKELETVIAAALADSGLEAQYLELELTESLMMHNVDEAVATLAALKRLGITLSIDDFGTGYSSLAYLRLFPLDYLKIDQSFIRDMLDDPSGAAIVRSVIALGHSLNFKVIAEGVETSAQVAYLARYQCDEMQGYHFSRPLPPDEFALLLRQEKMLARPQEDAPPRQTLLLDDEPNVLSSLMRLLRRDHYTILSADTPERAFELLAMHEVQVVISDQRMPAMSGTEFLSRVKKLYPGTIRIILSGYTDLESVLGAINRGEIYRFYTKPWDDAVLRDNIRDAFAYHQLIRGMVPAR